MFGVAALILLWMLCGLTGFVFQYATCLRYLRKATFMFIKVPIGYGKWMVIAFCPLPVMLESLNRPWDYYSEAAATEAIKKMKADRNLINAQGF
jgi:hypothetical protein